MWKAHVDHFRGKKIGTHQNLILPQNYTPGENFMVSHFSKLENVFSSNFFFLSIRLSYCGFINAIWKPGLIIFIYVLDRPDSQLVELDILPFAFEWSVRFDAFRQNVHSMYDDYDDESRDKHFIRIITSFTFNVMNYEGLDGLLPEKKHISEANGNKNTFNGIYFIFLKIKIVNCIWIASHWNWTSKPTDDIVRKIAIQNCSVYCWNRHVFAIKF